jgi:type II secretory pathway predicted ATPase ExeA
VYNCAVDDPKGRPPPADDPLFLASLSGLDAGLTDHAQPSTPTHPAPPRSAVASPQSIADAFDALTNEASSPSAGASPRRPLLDMFPSEGRAGRRAPPAARERIERRESVRPEKPAPGSMERFYGLREKPFALTADPRFFFHSRSHDRAGQQLLTAIRERPGLVVFSGEIGTGKTTLCRVIVEELDRRTLMSHITDPFVSAEELLTQILCDFGVLSREEVARGPLATRDELSAILQSFVESLAPLEASAVVIVDEAHNLSGHVLEQVRLLCEAADATRLLQVVLVGQPSLVALLRRAGSGTLDRRVTVRAVLQPLDEDEIGSYVSHRLAAAGDDVSVQFDEQAIARVFTLTRGVPRAINLLCDRALAHGHEESAAVIGEDAIEAAAEDLDLESPPSRLRRVGARAAAAVVLALFAALGAAGAAWLFRDALARAISRWW